MHTSLLQPNAMGMPQQKNPVKHSITVSMILFTTQQTPWEWTAARIFHAAGSQSLHHIMVPNIELTSHASMNTEDTEVQSWGAQKCYQRFQNILQWS